MITDYITAKERLTFKPTRRKVNELTQEERDRNENYDVNRLLGRDHDEARKNRFGGLSQVGSWL